MANTLTDLIPDMMTALNVVSREKVGFITAVSADPQTERAAIGQTVRSPIAPAATTANNTPNVTPPDTGDQTIDNVDLAITKSKHVPVRWNGEETLGLSNAGTFQNIQQQRFAEAFRALTNEIEADIAALYVHASRAYGTAGTAPFATANDLTDLAGAAQILDDNGCPSSDRQLVLGSAAMFNMRGKQSGLFNVDAAGSSDLLRTGMTDLLQGFAIRYSGQVAAHTKGAGSGYLMAAAGSVGDTSLTVDTGSGTILAGDVLTHASDSENKYVVGTALSGGTVVLNKPGLRIAAADNDALTVGNSFTANMAFHRSALVLATRLPAMPQGGDMATDVVQVQDPVSGLVFEVAEYKQYLQTSYHVRIAWGVKGVKPEHCAILLG